MNHNSTVTPGRQEVAASVLVFALPFFTLFTQRGFGICSVLFLAAALILYRQGAAALLHHWDAVRWVVLAFAAHAALAVILLLRPGSEGMNAEKPLRMLLALSVMLVVLACQPRRRALWLGVIAGAIAGAMLIAQQRVVLGMLRPGGIANAITAGDLLTLLGLFSLVAALEWRGRALALPAIGAVAGIGGALITGTRGCLVALAAGVAFYVWHMRTRRWARAMAAGFVLLCAALWFIPITGVQQRALEGWQEIARYPEQNIESSSMGQRLELWRAALLLIPARPLFGAGNATVRADLQQFVRRGVINPEVLPREHFHNNVLQVLVFGGIAGLCAWLAILIAPLVFFARRLRKSNDACALAGVLLVTSYFVFGLTEVIFWSMRANLFYASMVFLLMGLCLNAKEKDGK